MTVSSPEVRWAYKEACGLPEEAIIATGISRTDRFFDREFHKRAKKKSGNIFCLIPIERLFYMLLHSEAMH